MFGSEKRKERKEAKAEAKAERKEAKVQAKELKAEAKAERKEAKAAEKAERKARKSGDNAARTKIGMQSSRRTFRERMNVLMHRGAKLDDEFWDGLEEILIMSDIGARTSLGIVDNLREAARRKALPDGDAVNDLLIRQIAEAFPTADNPKYENAFNSSQAAKYGTSSTAASASTGSQSSSASSKAESSSSSAATESSSSSKSSYHYEDENGNVYKYDKSTGKYTYTDANGGKYTYNEKTNTYSFEDASRASSSSSSR